MAVCYHQIVLKLLFIIPGGKKRQIYVSKATKKAIGLLSNMCDLLSLPDLKGLKLLCKMPGGNKVINT